MPYLTKSRFATAITCPRKLAYLDDARYAQTSATDTFLQSLAEGGHQVGALAKSRFPNGIEIDAHGHQAQLEQTRGLLLRPNVTLFEAAIAMDSLFIRIDVLQKRGDRLYLYEVKAKSFDSKVAAKGNLFVGKRGLLSDYLPYLLDVAFQRHVLRKAFPRSKIQCFLMIPDKAQRSPEADVAMRLPLVREGDRVSVRPDPSLAAVARTLLAAVRVDRYCDMVELAPLQAGGKSFGFSQAIATLERQVISRRFATPTLGNHCKTCEFVASESEHAQGRLDGRAECWARAAKVPPKALRQATILDLCGRFDVAQAVADGNVVLAKMSATMLRPVAWPTNALTDGHRQALQCDEAKGKRKTPYVIAEGLRRALAGLRHPLHFVDFETAAPALPFHKGRRPYEMLWFQFSHHTLQASGALAHMTQYLHPDASFPNYDTLRAFVAALGERGSVVHWWTHERTVLEAVKRQLRRSRLADRVELCARIDAILGRMVDLGQAVLKPHVYLPGTAASCSLKPVLPALLKVSAALRSKYSLPIYGSENGIPSANFRDHAWVRVELDGSVLDPYAMLRACGPEVLDFDVAEREVRSVVADGGAAMAAYALLQSGTLTSEEVSALRGQLLRYCELDTFAMVLAHEGLTGMLGLPIVARSSSAACVLQDARKESRYE